MLACSCVLLHKDYNSSFIMFFIPNDSSLVSAAVDIFYCSDFIQIV